MGAFGGNADICLFKKEKARWLGAARRLCIITTCLSVMKKPDFTFRLSLLEIFLLEVAGWLALWLINDYLATLLTLILTAIVFAVLAIALVSELIERSKVPRWYFWVMGISILAPLVSAGIYLVIFGGRLEFLSGG